MVGAEPHGEILEGRHLERRTILLHARASGRAVETRHETRSSDTLTRRVSSRECATQTTGGVVQRSGASEGGDVASRGIKPSDPRAGDEVTCGAASLPRRAQEKSRFARNVCIRSHYFLSGQFCARGNIATDGKNSLGPATEAAAGAASRTPANALDRLPRRKPFSLVDGTLAAAPRAGAAYKVRVSRRAARCSRTTRTSW